VRSGVALFESTDSIAATGAATYALPASYYGTVAVEYQDGNGVKIPLRPISKRDAHRFSWASSSSVATHYRRVGSNMVLYPTPSSGTYIHTYIPAPTKFTSDADTIDGISGWEEYIIVDCAIKAYIKEESNPVQLEQRKAELIDRIDQNKANLALMEYPAVGDSSLNPVDAADYYPRRGRWWR